MNADELLDLGLAVLHVGGVGVVAAIAVALVVVLWPRSGE